MLNFQICDKVVDCTASGDDEELCDILEKYSSDRQKINKLPEDLKTILRKRLDRRYGDTYKPSGTKKAKALGDILQVNKKWNEIITYTIIPSPLLDGRIMQ